MNILGDNALYPIAAFDFDGTLSLNGRCPDIQGTPRQWARQVLNFLVNIGVKVVIWTNRDSSMDGKSFEFDDITEMMKWFQEYDINYSSINESYQFAPYHYKARKIFAHRFVDDRAYGFDSSNEDILLDVLEEFLVKILRLDNMLASRIRSQILFSDDHDVDKEIIDECKKYIKEQWTIS